MSIAGKSAQHERPQIFLVDAIKAVSSQLIVLHHLAWYGPMSDVAATLSPFAADIFRWLAEYARYAVAAFLAVAGYLAAQALGPGGLPTNSSPLHLIGRRYLRLAGPFVAAMILAIACTWLARQWMSHDSLGNPPQIDQFLAHVFLLHGLLGYESLSAGVWYVAIDFQLYSLLVLLLWIARKRAGIEHAEHRIAVPMGMLTFAALFYFGRHDVWDATAFYFFGAYGMGIFAGWAARSAILRRWLLVAMFGAIGALWFDFRGRLVVAILVALALLLPVRISTPLLLTRLSQTSYALFLVHFPVCLLVNAMFYRLFPEEPVINLLGVFLAWLASNMAASHFYQQIEQRLVPWLLGRFFRRQSLVR